MAEPVQPAAPDLAAGVAPLSERVGELSAVGRFGDGVPRRLQQLANEKAIAGVVLDVKNACHERC